MSKKVRIIKRTYVCGGTSFIIQQKHWLMFWKWVDAYENDTTGRLKYYFDTIEEAKKNLCLFDGTGLKEEVVV
jgi:hypothetical protein